MSKRTPTPWLVEQSQYTLLGHCYWIGSEKPGTNKVDEIVCRIGVDSEFTAQAKERRAANAAFIVEACNGYDAACAERDAIARSLEAEARDHAATEDQRTALAARVERLEASGADLVGLLREARHYVLCAGIDCDSADVPSLLARIDAALSPQAEKLEKEGV